MTFLEVLGWVVRQDILDIRSRSAFGILLCGVLIGVIVSVIAFLNFRIGENEPDVFPMSYQDLVVILLMIATFVVGVVVPLAGVFAFVFFRRDVLNRSAELIEKEMEEGGELRLAIEVSINNSMKDEQGVLRQFLADVVRQEVQSRAKTPKGSSTEWGNELDEYGDVAKPKESNT